MPIYKKNVIYFSIIATFAFFGLASFLPLTSMWGFNHLHFLPETFIYLYIFVFLLIIYLIVGPVPEKQIDRAIDKIDEWLWGSKILPRLILIAICTIIFILFRIETHFLGDSYSWLEMYGRGKAYILRSTEPGSVLVLRQIQALLGGYTRETTYIAFCIMSIGSGAIYFYNMLSIIKQLITGKPNRILALSTFLFSGSVLLFFGYVEFYPILWAVVSIFLMISIKYLSNHRYLIVVIGLYLLALFIHIQAIYFIPGFMFLIVKKFKRPEIRKIGYLFMGMGAIAVSLFLIWLYKTNLGFKILILPLFIGRPSTPEYSLFSLPHLIDLINISLLIFPGALILITAFILSRKKKVWDERSKFLALLSSGSILFLLVYATPFSMGRDWDLMALSLIAPSLLLLYLIDRVNDAIPKVTLVMMYVLITFFCTFSYLTACIKKYPSEKRIHVLLGNRDITGWVAYADHFLAQGDTTSFREIHRERIDLFPGIKKIKQAYKFIEEGDYYKAGKLADELVEMDPYNSNYLQLKGLVYDKLGQYDSSKIFYDKVLQLRPDRFAALNETGQLYIKLKDYDKAIKILQKAHQIVPDTTSIVEALALAYIHKNEYEKALSFADTLISKDVHSPGASLIRLTIAARQGDWASARNYYLEFLQYGRGRSDYENMRDYYKSLK